MKTNYVWKYINNDSLGVQMKNRIVIVPLTWKGLTDRSRVTVLPPLDEVPFQNSAEAYRAAEKFRMGHLIEIDEWRCV